MGIIIGKTKKENGGGVKVTPVNTPKAPVVETVDVEVSETPVAEQAETTVEPGEKKKSSKRRSKKTAK